MKTCTCCNKEKSEDEFYQNKSKFDGLAGWCKECMKINRRKYINKPNVKPNRYPNSKVCSACRQRKFSSEFNFSIISLDGLSSQCKKCSRNAKLELNFGITMTQYELMLKLQNGVCAICGQPEAAKYKNKIKALAVDHNHKTDKVRGLLCQHCNHMLGNANDNPELLEAAAKYLRES